MVRLRRQVRGSGRVRIDLTRRERAVRSAQTSLSAIGRRCALRIRSPCGLRREDTSSATSLSRLSTCSDGAESGASQGIQARVELSCPESRRCRFVSQRRTRISRSELTVDCLPRPFSPRTRRFVRSRTRRCTAPNRSGSGTTLQTLASSRPLHAPCHAWRANSCACGRNSRIRRAPTPGRTRRTPASAVLRWQC